MGADCRALSQTEEDVTVAALLAEIIERLERFDDDLLRYQNRVRQLMPDHR